MKINCLNFQLYLSIFITNCKLGLFTLPRILNQRCCIANKIFSYPLYTIPTILHCYSLSSPTVPHYLCNPWSSPSVSHYLQQSLVITHGLPLSLVVPGRPLSPIIPGSFWSFPTIPHYPQYPTVLPAHL